ncbi:hypothetical protein GS597_10920 [Synechococcales cyanobacterium C]|uniref:Uncharacterized protein n=1 Tax=Petrachloros mirabilis ULC683 TaxID=2781853 RepID=A0A8K2A7K7_9CYAN|nr:hypothetical protein [Petrachloros mirabilis]NCJ07011.1 hypothetical protein [Petrachloros mirabilis ULC683]
MDSLGHFRGLFLGVGVGERLTLGYAPHPSQSFMQSLLTWGQSQPSEKPPEQALMALLPTFLLGSDSPWQWQDYIRRGFSPQTDLEWHQTAQGLGAILVTILADPMQSFLTVLPRSWAQLEAAGFGSLPILETVQTLLEQRVALMGAIAALSPQPCPQPCPQGTDLPSTPTPSPEAIAVSPLTLLALACYTWLSTATHFHLSLQRARHIPAPRILPILVAALSGFSNTARGIPPLDLLRLETSNPLGQTDAQILTVAADRLYMQWAGIGANPNVPLELLEVAIAPPDA